VFSSLAGATGVPVGGYLPFVGLGLSNEDKDDFTTTTFYHTSQPTSGMMLGYGNPVTPNFDLALLDSGAGFSLLTRQAWVDFNMDGPYSGNTDGFRGTEEIEFEGATGSLFADVNDPVGLYAAGLQARTGGPSFAMNLNTMTGQTNTSMVSIQDGADSDLPNIVGMTFASRYATYIRSDLPQIFEKDGRTVRSPAVEFHPLGSGGQGITRRAPMSLGPTGAFSSPPVWVYNFEDFDIDHPQEDPSAPTVFPTGFGGAFLNVNAKENNQQLGNEQFLFDTGADVTVVSSLSAIFLGYQGVPDFTVAVVGSGGTAFDVPGFFLDELTVFAEHAVTHAESNLVLTNVPVIILNVTDPRDPENVVPGIIGTNIVAGRNVVLDPKPGGDPGPSLYISDPITTQKNWTSTAASATFGTGSNWSGSSAPNNLGIANVRHVSGGNQTAVVAANTTVWELNVSGTVSNSMTVQVQNGVTLQTFSGINIEVGGRIELQNATLDTQYVEMLAGTLTGQGTIETGSGPIPGQVENRAGTVAPGNGVGELEIIGRFSNGPAGIVAMQLGGDVAGQYDLVTVDGPITLAGTLSVSLVNSFLPSAGDAFTLMTYTDGLVGAFETLNLPVGHNWGIDYSNDAVVLNVHHAGDFNVDGVVDAADYVWWRKTGGSAQQYQDWVQTFGQSLGGGSGTGAAGVPEPGSAVVALVAICGLLLGRSSVANGMKQ
jgi:hypothetical protein